MAHPVVHFEVSGQDLDKLNSFYAELFGWKTQKVPGDMPYAMVEKEDGGIGGGIGQAPNGNGHVTFYVDTDDPQATLDKVEQLGGKTILPVTELPQVTIALFADPEGPVVGPAKGMERRRARACHDCRDGPSDDRGERAAREDRGGRRVRARRRAR